MTPESLRAEAEALETQAESLQKEAARRRSLAAQIEQLTSGLSPSPDSVTIGTMPEGQTYRLVKKGLHRGPALKSRGPAAIVAKRLGLSLRGLAEKIGVPYETLKKQDARRSVPEEVQKKLDRLTA